MVGEKKFLKKILMAVHIPRKKLGMNKLVKISRFNSNINNIVMQPE